jgi:hypothetical protein
MRTGTHPHVFDYRSGEDAMPDAITGTLRAALSRLEAERQRVDRQIAAIRTALGGVSNGRAPARRRRPMTAAARRAVSQRMKAYWAERRGSKPGGGKSGPARAKAKTEKPAAK